jgi:hypothetical protein
MYPFCLYFYLFCIYFTILFVFYPFSFFLPFSFPFLFFSSPFFIFSPKDIGLYFLYTLRTAGPVSGLPVACRWPTDISPFPASLIRTEKRKRTRKKANTDQFLKQIFEYFSFNPEEQIKYFYNQPRTPPPPLPTLPNWICSC